LVLAALLHELCDNARPSGLVAGADSGTVITMKVFVKLD